jgi:hypothetical protein
MTLTRREWLALVAVVSAPISRGRRAAAAVAPVAPVVQDAGTPQRIGDVIRQYEAQGYHRTATTVDGASAEWLAEQVQGAGLTPALEPFPLSRVDPLTNALIAGDRRITGIPVFDAAFTSESGIRGRLGSPDTDREIALTETAVNAAGAGPLGNARRANRFKAIVAVTRGRRPGLCPSNADSFLRPFGPPVLQVASEEAAWLTEQATRGVEVQLIASVGRTQTTATNVTAVLQGSDPTLPPFVVMTPRSGWYWCASERGGGIASWLEIIRALHDSRPKRSVLFVASSGHELGHLGIDAFIDRRPGIVKSAVGWLHLGANIGAAVEPGTTLQASDDEMDAALSRAMAAAGLAVTRRNPRGTVPGGEAEAVHNGGGRYVSVIGGNGLFHNPDDRGPQAVDPVTIAKFGVAFTSVVRGFSEA